MPYNFKSIIEGFDIKGKFVSAVPYGSGHINDSILVIYKTIYFFHNINKRIKDLKRVVKQDKYDRRKFAEKENLILGAKLMTYIIGIRFLTDYLNGDKYFKIHHPNQNLDRCRNQFKLLSSIEEQETEMQDILNKFV